MRYYETDAIAAWAVSAASAAEWLARSKGDDVMGQNRSNAVMATRVEAHDWHPVPSFPGYFASSDGFIKGPRGKILRSSINRGGYHQVNICRDGKTFSRRVHTLVCEAFHGPRPSLLHQSAHGDGRRANNNAGNLRWATRRENREDMRAHGTWPAFEAHPRAGITCDQAAEIRRRHAEAKGVAYAKRGIRPLLAAEFGVSIHVIKDIIGNRSW